MSNINDQNQTHDQGSSNAISAPATPTPSYVAPPPAYYSTGKDAGDIKSKGDGFWRGFCSGLCCYCCLDMCF